MTHAQIKIFVPLGVPAIQRWSSKQFDDITISAASPDGYFFHRPIMFKLDAHAPI